MSTSKRKSGALRLIKGTDKPGTSSQPPPKPHFNHKLLRHPDRTLASEIAADQASYEFDQEHGLEHTQIQLEVDDLDIRFNVSDKQRDTLEKKRAGTKRYIKSAGVQTGEDLPRSSFSGWLMKDRILLISILLMMLACMSLGVSNVYTNLMSSGNATFIETPWMAWMLSALLPIGSASVKFVTNFFAYDTSRRRYALTIYTLTLITLIVWSILFAQNFNGASGGIDWDSLGESNGKGSALVWAQLSVELLSASALFLAAEDIYMRYSPDVYLENLEYRELDRAVKSHHQQHDALREARAHAHGRLKAMEAKRQGFINERVTDFLHLSSRYSAANDLSI